MILDELNLETAPTTQLHRRLGANLIGEDRCQFAIWAPNHDQIFVELAGRGDWSESPSQLPMQKRGSYHVAIVDGVTAGDRYFYRIGQGPPRPDPASAFQPEGVHGPSEVVSHSFEWNDATWNGVARDDLIIYELHIGAFTDAGTFVAAIERLDELIDLGITAIEIMPVAAAAGRWNWGYDGVCLFAPHCGFGSPDDFRRLVDAAHGKGLAVILDVVYNHLGPEGNYLSEFGPYLSSQHTTAWGAAPNFDHPSDCREVRRFFVANLIHWFDRFHIDGLRVDAIHCMRDDSEPHITIEMAAAVRHWSRENSRSVSLIAESNVYDPDMLTPINQGGTGFDAQWCDDFLHSVFAVLRPNEKLCHRPYRSGADLAQTLNTGYVYEGTVRSQRGRSSATDRVDTHGMIYSIQNHDFIGNHPLGKRLHQLTSIPTQQAAAALLMLLPPIPMLFMGEEFACEHPFQFFVDFGDAPLRQAVVEGRKAEYPQHDWSGGISPLDPRAFLASKIGPAAQGDPVMRPWYRQLIAIRKDWRNRGLLCDENLRVNADPKTGLYRFDYVGQQETATVLVRLDSSVAPTHDSDRAGDLDRGGDLERGGDLVVDVSGRLVLDSLAGQTGPGILRTNHAQVLTSFPSPVLA